VNQTARPVHEFLKTKLASQQGEEKSPQQNPISTETSRDFCQQDKLQCRLVDPASVVISED